MSSSPIIRIEKVEKLNTADLSDLCQATEDSIRDGIGFNWLTPPAREVLEAYWRGVLVVPERVLFVGRLDGAIAGAIQLRKPSPSKQSTAFSAEIDKHFVAPWARGHGMASELLNAAESDAIRLGYRILRLDVRGTQEAAIRLYEHSGYQCWGVLDWYEEVKGEMVSGHFFIKDLIAASRKQAI